jgi:hypothetical protein
MCIINWFISFEWNQVAYATALHVEIQWHLITWLIANGGFFFGCPKHIFTMSSLLLLHPNCFLIHFTNCAGATGVACLLSPVKSAVSLLKRNWHCNSLYQFSKNGACVLLLLLLYYYLNNNYPSTLADSTLIVLFSEMLKVSEIISSKSKNIVKDNSEYNLGDYSISWN